MCSGGGRGWNWLHFFGLHVSGGRRVPWPRGGLWKVIENE